jgi:hypothetical protein
VRVVGCDRDYFDDEDDSSSTGTATPRDTPLGSAALSPSLTPQQVEEGAVYVVAEHDPTLRIVCYRGDNANVVRRAWGTYPNGVLRNARRQSVETIGDDPVYVFSFPHVKHRSVPTPMAPQQVEDAAAAKRPASVYGQSSPKVGSSTRRCVSCTSPGLAGV